MAPRCERRCHVLVCALLSFSCFASPCLSKAMPCGLYHQRRGPLKSPQPPALCGQKPKALTDAFIRPSCMAGNPDFRYPVEAAYGTDAESLEMKSHFRPATEGGRLPCGGCQDTSGPGVWIDASSERSEVFLRASCQQQAWQPLLHISSSDFQASASWATGPRITSNSPLWPLCTHTCSARFSEAWRRTLAKGTL